MFPEPVCPLSQAKMARTGKDGVFQELWKPLETDMNPGNAGETQLSISFYQPLPPLLWKF